MCGRAVPHIGSQVAHWFSQDAEHRIKAIQTQGGL